MKNEDLEGVKKRKATKKAVSSPKKTHISEEVVNDNVDTTSYVEIMNYPKKKGHGWLYAVIVFVLIAITAVIIWVVKPASLGFASEKGDDNSKIELKHTESIKPKSDGVYITDVSDVVEEVMPSIVSITSKTVINSGRLPFYGYGNNSNSYTTVGAGSGVIIASSKDEIYILTNNHVVDNSTELSVKFFDDESCDATIKGVSVRKDVAVVVVKKSNMKKDTLEKIKVATLGSSDDLKVGNGIIAIGNALGYGQSVTTGVVSALNREVKGDDNSQSMIQIDAAINGGNSGGALLNSKGEVVGINTAKYSSNLLSSGASIEGMGFAIPISDVEDIIKDLMNGKNDESKDLTIGIEGYMTNTGGISSYNLPQGFYIAAITKGGNAEKSDLEIGNIIVKVDGKEVTSMDVFKGVLNKKSLGDKITLTVKYPSRNEYKEKDVVVILSK